jgi:hypothetical protein
VRGCSSLFSSGGNTLLLWSWMALILSWLVNIHNIKQTSNKQKGKQMPLFLILYSVRNLLWPSDFPSAGHRTWLFGPWHLYFFLLLFNILWIKWYSDFEDQPTGAWVALGNKSTIYVLADWISKTIYIGRDQNLTMVIMPWGTFWGPETPWLADGQDAS